MKKTSIVIVLVGALPLLPISAKDWPVKRTLVQEKKDEAQNPAQPKPLYRIPCPDGATCFAFTPDGKTLAVGHAGTKGTIRFFDTASGKQLKPSFDHKSNRSTKMKLAFSPDCSLLVSIRLDFAADVKVWKWETENEIFWLKNQRTGGVPQFDPGNRLVIARADGLFLYDLAKKEPTMLDGLATDGQLAISHDGKKVAFATANGRQLFVYDIAARNAVKVLEKPPGFNDQNGFVWSRDGKRVVSAAPTRVINIWDLATQKVQKQLPFKVRPLPLAQGHSAIAASPDLGFVALSGTTAPGAPETQFWDTTTGKTAQLMGHGCVAISADGKLVATTHDFFAVAIWETTTIHKLLK